MRRVGCQKTLQTSGDEGLKGWIKNFTDHKTGEETEVQGNISEQFIENIIGSL